MTPPRLSVTSNSEILFFSHAFTPTASIGYYVFLQGIPQICHIFVHLTWWIRYCLPKASKNKCFVSHQKQNKKGWGTEVFFRTEKMTLDHACIPWTCQHVQCIFFFTNIGVPLANKIPHYSISDNKFPVKKHVPKFHFSKVKINFVLKELQSLLVNKALRKDFVILQLYWCLFSSTTHCSWNMV